MELILKDQNNIQEASYSVLESHQKEEWLLFVLNYMAQEGYKLCREG